MATYIAAHGGYRTDMPCQLVLRSFEDSGRFGEAEHVTDCTCDLGELDDFVEQFIAPGASQDAGGSAPEQQRRVIAARDFRGYDGECRAYLIQNIPAE